MVIHLPPGFAVEYRAPPRKDSVRYAFVLSRVNEYEADACAVQATGAASASSALLRIHVLNHLIDDQFWPEVYQSANRQSDPPENPFAELAIRLAKGPAPDAAAGWLRVAQKIATGTQDTHPSLTDRLHAIHQLTAPEGRASGEAGGQ